MKKLLTTITISALVGTSASNLKPVLINNVVNYGFKSNQIKDISITNENDTNPFLSKQLINGIASGISLSSVIVAPNGKIYAGTDGKGLWKSTDGFKFEQVKSEISNTMFVTSIAITPNGTIYVGQKWNILGIYKSTDGINFIPVVNDDVKNVISMTTAANGNVYFSIYKKGLYTVYKSTDGNTFTAMTGTTGEIKSLTTDKNNNIYAGSVNGIVYKSTDGNTFTAMTGTTGEIKSLTTDKNNNIYAGSVNGIVYKSTDGNTFTAMTGTTGEIKSLTTDKNNNIYAGSVNGIVYKSTDGNTFTAMTGTTGEIKSLTTDKNNNIYAGSVNGIVYKSTDGNTFTAMTGTTGEICSLTIDKNNNIYAATNKGLWIINPINLLLNVNKPDTFDKSWPLYKGIVYNSAQKIDIKENLVASATLDGSSITIPTTNLDIPVGKHNLVLTLKDEYKQYLDLFDGDTSTGQVTYKLWVKTAIDKNKIDYQTKINDTELFTGLVSNAGNTKSKDIIQTKIKDGTGTHNASINLSLNDNLIDFDVNKSFYEQGIVDSSNNFIENPTSKKTVSQNLSIQNDGIYHLHLEDTVGNQYDSYLELGKSNWKLTGDFNDSELDKLKTKLNVSVNLTDPTQKQKALGWLHQYENFVDKIFEETIKTNGKGFDSEIKQQITSYTAFLKPLTYDIANEPKFDDGLDKNALVKTITDKAKELLKNGLDILPKHLNVNTSNVVNKSTLTSYTNWINNYQIFINKNKDKWINDISNIASRGFATKDQENQIKAQVSQFLNNDTIKKYLKNIVWEDNKLLKATSNDYLQYVELDKLQTDTINWVNEKLPDINQKYQKAIQDAESDLNLHGYSIYTLLNGKPQPQTKTEIDNFSDGQSYHDWLQSQANIKFRGWQLAMGFGIAIPLLIVIGAIGWVIRSRTNPKYNGVSRARKENKQDKKTLAKTLREEEKHNKK